MSVAAGIGPEQVRLFQPAGNEKRQSNGEHPRYYIECPPASFGLKDETQLALDHAPAGIIGARYADVAISRARLAEDSVGTES